MKDDWPKGITLTREEMDKAIADFPESIDTLILGVLGFVYQQVKRWTDLFGGDIDENVGNALYAVCESAPRYNPKQSRFTTFVGIVVRNAMIRYRYNDRAIRLPATKPTSHESLLRYNAALRGSFAEHEDTPDHRHETDSLEIQELLHVMDKVLTERERAIVMRLQNGEQSKVIAADCGISRARVFQIRNEAFEKIRERYQYRIDLNEQLTNITT